MYISVNLRTVGGWLKGENDVKALSLQVRAIMLVREKEHEKTPASNNANEGCQHRRGGARTRDPAL